MVGKRSVGDYAFDIVNVLFLTAASFLFLFPVWYVAVSSLSSPAAVASGDVTLWPKGFTWQAYELVLKDSRIWEAYANTLFYVGAGTLLNLIMTTLGAYPLSRRQLLGGSAIMAMIVFTMFFSGGLIPSYLNIRDLGLYNTRWVLIVPAAVSAFNLIVLRTFFQTIPESLIESAKIDGAQDIRVLWSVVLPLSKPGLAVMLLFYAVAHWNSWFSAMVYLQDRSLYPLQLVLREILIHAQTSELTANVPQQDVTQVSATIRYATIMIATLPILLLYPFLQKHFVKGVMIGALKE
ncbi:carbohydrate ABC transporter permease [Cohnella hashimotonis]|uniref:Carbohydrate ABC transporter permease n=1 Tax=Cohnella hashimotonis TaxID=2826895 RepID=A0ABT6TFH5_9BACL|nr:carbohydrate ABC transporter permease [Cohnella hashimotonis]MDI4645038.1 carbohydrate ABC transporter permease [Cohnella hashimotonis]